MTALTTIVVQISDIEKFRNTYIPGHIQGKMTRNTIECILLNKIL